MKKKEKNTCGNGISIVGVGPGMLTGSPTGYNVLLGLQLERGGLPNI